MSDAIIKNKAFLDLLCKTKSEEQRQALLDTATPGQIRALSEVALNLYCKRTKQPVLKHSKLLLEENLPVINKLIKRNRPFGLKKRILRQTHEIQGVNQEGAGIFSILIPLLASVIGSAVAGS